jgi:Mn2+/Fe2+ NRAMP family transporter
VFVCYIFAGILAHPDWKSRVCDRHPAAGRRHGQLQYLYTYTLIGLAARRSRRGCSSIYKRRSWKRDHGAAVQAARWDVIVGSLFAAVIAWFIIVACAATLHTAGRTEIRDAADAAQALRPLAGEYAYILFAAGLFNASLFAATVLPISTSYTVCEGLGFESGLDKKFHEAPAFYWLYTLLIVAGAGVLLIPRVPLVPIMVLSQVVNGVVLPFVLVFMLLLTNDRELMGEREPRRYNIIAGLRSE